ncbi:hypothetical protein [Ralstonia syzygii]|uniref:Novel STAND NTPase 1 domain-containing protein n=1 Tax=Ralstonia syzygii R24 TaxID=907261 RepID=G3A7U5_9RALS|nr:hypothetical protein [Ralstonia syzygii]CCA86581.1 conserved hypothetical protein, WD-40 repeat-containing protein [Ralstonia syzygii R24]
MTAPYVGPSPFCGDQHLFGRDTEIEELQWRLVADRIIVLYSSSGAGKTSLLMAKNGLVAQLRERFHVLPVLRVGSADGTDPTIAMLRQLESGGFGPMRDGDTLLTYFDRIAIPEAHPPKRLLLVLDQFEEIFTNFTSLAEQRKFFLQLGELLSRETSPIWLIVSMREEYFSWLDSFRDVVPTRLVNTFRLNLLSTDQAVAAMKGPAEAAGVAFPVEAGQDAATYLVRKLSMVRRRTPGGASEPRAGNTVEAVQLQVICVDLWSRLSTNDRHFNTIRVADVLNYKPETALLDYCDKALSEATAKPPRASALRDWIDQRLLTPSGLRAPAMIDPADGNCPTPQELSALEEVHLIRRLSREDGDWYELAHDSVAGPVRRSIENWRTKNLEMWQQQARAWHLGGEQHAYFKMLPRRSKQNIPKLIVQNSYSEVERRFLVAYGLYTRQKWLWRSIFGLAALVIAIFSLLSWERLKAEADLLATRNAIAIQAGVLSILDSKPTLDLGARAVVAGTELQDKNVDAVAVDFRTLLGEYLNKARQIEKVESRGSGISKMILLDRDHRVVAEIGYGRRAVEVSETNGNGEVWKISDDDLKKIHPQGVRALALLGDGGLATGDSDGSLQIWNVKMRRPISTPFVASNGEHAPLMRSAVRAITSANGILYAGYELGVVAAWDLNSPQSANAQPLWTARLPSRVSALAIFKSGDTVAAADISSDEQVTLLKYANGKVKVVKLAAVPKEEDYKGAFYSIAISPDDRFVVAGNRAGKIHVWDIATRAHLWRIDAHDQTVAQLKFLRNGNLLSVGWDGRLKLWMFPPGGKLAPLGKTILEFPRQLISMAPVPDEQTVYVTTEKGDVLRVSLSTDKHPIGQLLAKQGTISRLVESGEQLRLITAARNSLMMSSLDGRTSLPRNTVRTSLPMIVDTARAESAKALFVAQKDQVIAFRDNQPEGKRLESLRLPSNEEIMSIHVDDSGSLLVARTQTTESPRRSRTRVWALSPATLTVLSCEIQLPTSFPRAPRFVAFRPFSSDFITVEMDTILVWSHKENSLGCPEIQEGSYRIPAKQGEIDAIAFDPSGKLLWVSNFIGQLYLVALDSKEPQVSVIKDDSTTVPSALAVSANHTVAMGDTSGRLYVIPPGSPQPVQIGQDFHDSQITSLAISRDGNWLVSSSDVGTAVWDLRIETWIRKACELAANRSFNADENEKYFKRVTEKPTPCATSG